MVVPLNNEHFKETAPVHFFDRKVISDADMGNQP